MTSSKAGESAIADILQFLDPNARFDLKVKATRVLTCLTGDPSGLKSIYTNKDILKALVQLLKDNHAVVDDQAVKCIVNLSADDVAANYLIDPKLGLVTKLFECIVDPNYESANYAAVILGNLTRQESICSEVLSTLQDGPLKLTGLVKIFGNLQYNKTGISLHVLGFVLTNISQIPQGRQLIMDKENHIFEKLLPFVKCEESKGRRISVLSLIHNCCMEEEYHEWLLSEEIDVVPTLLFPLVTGAGITDEENDELPVELQYLPEDKKIEEDVELKITLLESILKLSYCTETGKNKIKEMKILPLLKQYHSTETNKKCQELCMDIIGGILLDENTLQVRTTEEGGMFICKKS